MDIRDLVNTTRKFHGDWLAEGKPNKIKSFYRAGGSGYMCAIGCNLDEELLREMGGRAYLTISGLVEKWEEAGGLIKILREDPVLLKQARFLQEMHDTSFTISQYLNKLNKWEEKGFVV